MDRQSSPSDETNLDFAALLEESFEEIEDASRGDLLEATVLANDDHGLIVDLGLKRDGVVPRSEIEALDADLAANVGDRITVMVVETEDRDGNLLVSIQQALASQDWDAAHRQMEAGTLYKGRVIAANRGGVIVPYGELRGFIPASHIVGLPRGLDDEERISYLQGYVGQRLELKIIEVNPNRRRLVLSERQAQREAREKAKQNLLDTLHEGEVVTGTVSSLRDFGAFVDLGGADGLIHVSELAWHRVRHPGEIVSVGEEIRAYVLQLDHERQRIGLSLKRLLPNPWLEIERTHSIGQLVDGTVSRVVSFGAFVELENGIEALLHISEIADPQPDRVEDVLRPGDYVVAQIVNFEPHRQRMGLSIKHLTPEQRAEYVSAGAAGSEVDDTPDDVDDEEAVAELDVM
jgi:small subunit ribosomal protein S1